MNDTHAPSDTRSEPGQYEIRLKGHLDARWAAWFDGLSLTQESDGTTVIHGSVVDQAALAWLAELWEEQVRQRGSCPPHCSCWAPFHSLLASSASPSWPAAPRSRRPTHPFASPVPVVPSEPSPRDGQLVGVIRPLAFSPRPRASNASLIADSG